VAEHVLDYDHVEPLRVLNEPHRGGVDVGVLALDVGVVGLADLVEGAPPGVVDEGENVRLGDEVELFHVVTLAGEVKGVADRALGAEAGRHVDLRRGLVRRPLVLEAAHAAVQPLSVLAHDDEIDVRRALVLERAVDARIELDGAQVDVLVELEAQAEEDALLEDARFDVGVADGAEIDGIEAAQLLEDGVWKDVAGLLVALAAEVEVLEVELDASGGEDLQALADDFGASAVAGEDGYAVGHGNRELGTGRRVIGGEVSKEARTEERRLSGN